MASKLPLERVVERKNTPRRQHVAWRLNKREDFQAMQSIYARYGKPTNVERVNDYLRLSDDAKTRNSRECGYLLGRLRDLDHMWVILTIHDIPNCPIPPGSRWLSDYELVHLPYGALFCNTEERKRAKKEGRIPKSRWVGLLVHGTPTPGPEWENLVRMSKTTKLGGGS